MSKHTCSLENFSIKIFMWFWTKSNPYASDWPLPNYHHVLQGHWTFGVSWNLLSLKHEVNFPTRGENLVLKGKGCVTSDKPWSACGFQTWLVSASPPSCWKPLGDDTSEPHTGFYLLVCSQFWIALDQISRRTETGKLHKGHPNCKRRHTAMLVIDNTVVYLENSRFCKIKYFEDKLTNTWWNY